jgi:hypothetical protein
MTTTSRVQAIKGPDTNEGHQQSQHGDWGQARSPVTPQEKRGGRAQKSPQEGARTAGTEGQALPSQDEGPLGDLVADGIAHGIRLAQEGVGWDGDEDENEGTRQGYEDKRQAGPARRCWFRFCALVLQLVIPSRGWCTRPGTGTPLGYRHPAGAHVLAMSPNAGPGRGAEAAYYTPT